MAFLDNETREDSPIFPVRATFLEIQTEVICISDHELVERVWDAISGNTSHGMYYGMCGYFRRNGFISEKQRKVLQEFLIRWIMFDFSWR